MAAGEERYGELADSITDVFYALDRDLRYTFWNRESERISGLSSAEVVGHRLAEVFPEARGKRAEQAFLEVLKTRRSRSFEYTYRVGGEDRIFELSAYATRDGCAVFSKDITDRKGAEAELAWSREELRRLARHQERVREEERKRIVPEIHDEPAQRLSTLKLGVLQAAEELGPRGTDRLRAMSELIDGTIETTRTLCATLRPRVLDELGLPRAVEWLAREFERTAGVRCRVSQNDAALVAGEERSTAVFRILQEALANVSRHAKATRVTISLRRCGNDLRVDVADNGIGVAPGRLRDPHSFGLLGIRERALALGGTEQVAAGPGGGTVVTVTLPLSPEEG